MRRKKTTYKKVAKSLDEQVALLRNRGVVIADEAKAKEYLSDIGFYRLGLYIFPFEVTYPLLDSRRRHEVRPGTTIEEIVALYYFDFDLRSVLNRYLSRIEVSVRTTVVNELSMKYLSDSTWFVNPTVVTADFIASFNREVYSHIRSKSVIKRHHDKYFGRYAPAWKTIEFMTMGNIEALYENLLYNSDKSLISIKYNEPGIAAFRSYLSAIREVRNACAHGSILYDLKLTNGIITGSACSSFIPGTNQTLNGSLRVIDYMLRQISVNRARDMWNELYKICKKLYRKAPDVKSIIEQKTGIIVPASRCLFFARIFGKNR